MGDGRIGHAELAVSDGVLCPADEYPEFGLKAPAPKAVLVSLMLHVSDTDAALQKATEHGATVERETYEDYGTRNPTIDPFGHRWMFRGPARSGDDSGSDAHRVLTANFRRYFRPPCTFGAPRLAARAANVDAHWWQRINDSGC